MTKHLQWELVINILLSGNYSAAERQVNYTNKYHMRAQGQEGSNYCNLKSKAPKS